MVGKAHAHRAAVAQARAPTLHVHEERLDRIVEPDQLPAFEQAPGLDSPASGRAPHALRRRGAPAAASPGGAHPAPPAPRTRSGGGRYSALAWVLADATAADHRLVITGEQPRGAVAALDRPGGEVRAEPALQRIGRRQAGASAGHGSGGRGSAHCRPSARCNSASVSSPQPGSPSSVRGTGCAVAQPATHRAASASAARAGIRVGRFGAGLESFPWTTRGSCSPKPAACWR